MDIGGNRMEKVDLTNVKLLASEICKMYFNGEKDCEQKAEEAILEATNYLSDDPVKHFATMAILQLKYYDKRKDLFETFLINDNVSIFSLDMIARFSEFPYMYSLSPLSYDMCEQLSNDPRRCIDNFGFLSFWHDIHMYTLTFRHKGVPIDDEFAYLLYFLLRNITAQYVVSNDITRTEKLEKIISEYVKQTIKELREIDEEKKKNKKEEGKK